MAENVFWKVLEARRAYFNARFAQAEITRPNLDGDAFLLVLRDLVAPVVEAVAQQQAEAALVVGQHLYDLALDLFADGLLTPKGVITNVWNGVLPQLATFLVQEPQRVSGSVVNAAYNISQIEGARPQEWMELALALAPRCDKVSTFLQAGQVAAWRAGMAHYRLGALQILKTLDADLVRVIFGLESPPDAAALHHALSVNPWYDPARSGAPGTLKIVKRVGKFRGFGGAFLTPPRVFWTGEGFVTTDGADEYLLMADAFGATLHRTTDPRKANIASPFKLHSNGKVTFEKASVTLPELADATSSAANQTTLAVTSGLTHAISLVALAA